MLIDTHAHLTDEKYNGSRDELINSLKDNNVEKAFTVAYNSESIIECTKLAESYENVYAIIGVHPEDAGEFSKDTIELIKENAQSPKVIAIGEIGLDYHYDNYNKELQKKVFIKQLELANELELPVQGKVLPSNSHLYTYPHGSG